MLRRNFLAIAAAAPVLPSVPIPDASPDIRCNVALAPESIVAACALADFIAEFQLSGMRDIRRCGELYESKVLTTIKWDVNDFAPHIPDRLQLQAMYYCCEDPAESRRRYNGIWKRRFDMWFPGWSDDGCCWGALFGVRD